MLKVRFPATSLPSRSASALWWAQLAWIRTDSRRCTDSKEWAIYCFYRCATPSAFIIPWIILPCAVSQKDGGKMWCEALKEHASTQNWTRIAKFQLFSVDGSHQLRYELPRAGVHLSEHWSWVVCPVYVSWAAYLSYPLKASLSSDDLSYFSIQGVPPLYAGHQHWQLPGLMQ